MNDKEKAIELFEESKTSKFDIDDNKGYYACEVGKFEAALALLKSEQCPTCGGSKKVPKGYFIETRKGGCCL